MPELLAWIAKSRLKQGKNSLEIARFGNLAKPKDNFSGFSDNLLDPNNPDDPQYIVRLIKKVVTVSVPLWGIMETVKIVKGLP
ncbi:MAG: hypothetical protein EHM81_06795 [Chloroflexi bacterium]|nr:MAG: hypothetical protein EHM81_06795 [Chloroflexota bacterium]